MTSTDPFNYHVLLFDQSKDKEAARFMVLLGFHEKPTGAVNSSDEAQDHYEKEVAAMAAACDRSGIHLRPATPESAVSPTGRWYWNAFQVELFDRHVLIQQSGGLDC